MRVLYLIFFLGLGFLTKAQSFRIFDFDTDEQFLFTEIIPINDSNYLASTRVYDSDNREINPRLYLLNNNFQTIKIIVYDSVNIYSAINRNDSIFLFGDIIDSTSDIHKVWLLKDDFSLVEFNQWNFKNIKKPDFTQEIIYNKGLYYASISDVNKNSIATEVLVLDYNFNLIQEFEPTPGAQAYGLAVGDSTVFLSVGRGYLYKKDGTLLKIIDQPETVQPVLGSRKGYIYEFYLGVAYQAGRYITTGSVLESDVFRRADGRLDVDYNELIYGQEINEKGESLKINYVGSNGYVDRYSVSSFRKIVPLNDKDLFFYGITNPEGENGRFQSLGIFSYNNFESQSEDYIRDVVLGESNSSTHVFYIQSRNELILAGEIRKSNSEPYYAAYLSRLKLDDFGVGISAKKIIGNINLEIYPNPAKSQGKVNLSWSGMARQSWQLNMYDSQGQMVFATSIIQGNTASQVTLPQLPKGNFILRATGSNKQLQTGTFIVD